MTLPEDLRQLLLALNEHGVEYLVVGGWAVGFHSEPRATKDIDLFVSADVKNSEAVFRALAEFGTPLAGLTPADFRDNPTSVFQIGVAPARADILQAIDGVDFGEAWSRREEFSLDGIAVHVISAAHLVQNKLKSGRLRDLADVEAIREAKQLNAISPDLNADEIEAIVRFLGYGSLSAKVWFIGKEEGLGKMTSQEAIANLKQRGRFAEVMDLRKAHLELTEGGEKIDVEVNAPETPVWRWMGKIMLALEGCSQWKDPGSPSAKDYVRFRLGRDHGKTFLTELSPIPAKGAGDTNWMEWFSNHVPGLDKKLAQRKTKLQELIKENSPSLIICYGRPRADEFADLLGIKWEDVTPTMSRSNDGTRWLLPFFGTGRISTAIVEQFLAHYRFPKSRF